MLELQSVIDRLRDQVEAFRFIGGAADVPAAADELKQSPAAFVLPLADAASRNGDMVGSTTQQVTVRFGVLIALQNLRDARGEAALNSLTPVRLAVREAIVGWVPSGCEDPSEIAGGRILRLDDRVLWWQDDFLSMFIYRKVG